MIEQKVGISKIEIRDSVLYFNNVKIKLRGVNRHDSDGDGLHHQPRAGEARPVPDEAA